MFLSLLQSWRDAHRRCGQPEGKGVQQDCCNGASAAGKTELFTAVLPLFVLCSFVELCCRRAALGPQSYLLVSKLKVR
jgi:hypothetical protein